VTSCEIYSSPDSSVIISKTRGEKVEGSNLGQKEGVFFEDCSPRVSKEF
jgi:hypothetical protein